jgi:hypothetical protein
MMSYCTFLSFYVLLKLDGKDVTNHPVLFKLAHMRTLLEKLKPLDDKLQVQLDQMMDTAANGASAKYKSKGEELKIDEGMYGHEDQEMYGSESESDHSPKTKSKKASKDGTKRKSSPFEDDSQEEQEEQDDQGQDD